MARPDGRIEPGQPLAGAISARAWNRAQDAADLVMGRQGGFTAGEAVGPSLPYTWVYCKSAVTVDRWGVLAIDGLAITPSASESDAQTKSFQDTPVVTAQLPSQTTRPWGVAVEPIKSGSIGRLAVAGVVQLKKTDLSKAPGASVLWKDDNWALVRIEGGVVRGTFSPPWNKTATKAVSVAESTGVTITAKNYFATISGSATKNCAIAYANGEWILIAVEC